MTSKPRFSFANSRSVSAGLHIPQAGRTSGEVSRRPVFQSTVSGSAVQQHARPQKAEHQSSSQREQRSGPAKIVRGGVAPPVRPAPVNEVCQQPEFGPGSVGYTKVFQPVETQESLHASAASDPAHWADPGLGDNATYYQEIASKMGLSDPLEAFLCAPAHFEDYRNVVDDFRALIAQAAASDDANQGEHDQKQEVIYRARVAATPSGYSSIRGYIRNGTKVSSSALKEPQSRFRGQLVNPFRKECFRLEVDMIDDQGHQMVQSVFGNIWPWKDVGPGTEVVIRSSVTMFRGMWAFSGAQIIPAEQVGKVVPIYLGQPGKAVNSAEVHSMIEWVLSSESRIDQALDRAVDVIVQSCGDLPEQSILDVCVPQDSPISPGSIREFLLSLHFPDSVEQGEAALTVAKNICILSMQCLAEKVNARPADQDAPIASSEELEAKTLDLLDNLEQAKLKKIPNFAFTDNQREVASAIASRLGSTHPLRGLLSGEVGAGKTVAYAAPAVAAHLHGANVAIIAPTELLAKQIAEGIARDFGPDVQVERVMSGRKIKNPSAILVGTHGINSAAKKVGWVPDFLITDEQHKIHTAARQELIQSFTHTLEVSATPIPRSLGLSLHGGSDFFVLNEQPVKKHIKTHLLDASDRRVCTALMKEAIESGKRAAIVYTLVDKPQAGLAGGLLDLNESAAKPKSKAAKGQSDAEQEDQSRMSAIAAFNSLAAHFPGKVGLLHGKLTSAEKEEALDAFRAGQTPLLVTTTIFETGIDVPDISVLIVRDPERLGLSQLHQLRGRLARSGGDGTCVLLTADTQALSDDTYERLSFFCDNQDGHALAVQDMLTRGVGDLDALQQSGRAKTVFKSIKVPVQDLISLNEKLVELDVEVVHVGDQHEEKVRPERNHRQRMLT